MVRVLVGDSARHDHEVRAGAIMEGERRRGTRVVQVGGKDVDRQDVGLPATRNAKAMWRTGEAAE